MRQIISLAMLLSTSCLPLAAQVEPRPGSWQMPGEGEAEQPAKSQLKLGSGLSGNSSQAGGVNASAGGVASASADFQPVLSSSHSSISIDSPNINPAIVSRPYASSFSTSRSTTHTANSSSSAGSTSLVVGSFSSAPRKAPVHPKVNSSTVPQKAYSLTVPPKVYASPVVPKVYTSSTHAGKTRVNVVRTVEPRALGAWVEAIPSPGPDSRTVLPSSKQAVPSW